jgi:hypothetical protein
LHFGFEFRYKEENNQKRNDYQQVAIDFIHPSPPLKIEIITLPENKKLILYHVGIDYEKCYERRDNKKVY